MRGTPGTQWRDKLEFPEPVRFGNLRLGNSDRILCGQVNSRDRSGAYTGDRYFYYDTLTHSAHFKDEDPPPPDLPLALLCDANGKPRNGVQACVPRERYDPLRETESESNTTGTAGSLSKS